MFIATMTTANIIYPMAITGTMISLKRDMRWMPPQIIASVSSIRATDTHSAGRANEVCMASAMVLACTELNANPKVRVMRMAKVTAQGRLWRPWRM